MKIDIELGEVTNPDPSHPADFTVAVQVRFSNVQKPGTYEKVLNLVDEVKRDLPDGINPMEAVRIGFRVYDLAR